MANVGLYYPYIQFKDEAWLKLTALYWDQMARIVPDGFPLEDSADVRLLRDKEGFVFERAPDEAEKATVGEQFRRLISRHGDKLAKRFGLKLHKSWPVDPITVATEPEGNPHLAYVYPNKMDSLLAKALVGAKLAKYGPSRPNVGLGMHPVLADVYMLALARTVARNTGYEPVTDETRHHIGITACTMPQLVAALLGEVQVVAPANRVSRAEALLVNLAFKAVLPTNLKDVPMKKIVSIRKAWASERTRFQDGLKEIVKGLGEVMNVPDPIAFERHVSNAFKTKVGRPLQDLKKRLDRADIRTAIGAFSLSTTVPAGTLIAALTGGLALPIAGALALGLGIYGLVTTNRDKKDELMKSPAAYLVRLEKELHPSRLAEWIGTDMNHFQLLTPM